MKKYLYILPICLMLSSCASPTGTRDDRYTQKMVKNGYQIESVGSPYAYPSQIRVIPVENGLKVMGQVIRRTLHKNMSIRGHVDVEVLDTGNQVVKRKTVSLGPPTIHAKHDRSRSFSVTILETVSKAYLIRVRHNVGTADHQ